MRRDRVVLCVGDDALYDDLSGGRGHWTVRHVGTLTAARDALAAADCVVTAATLPDGSGVELCELVRDRNPDLPVVLVPDAGSDGLARRAVRAGVTEYLPRSLVDDAADLRAAVAAAAEAAPAATDAGVPADDPGRPGRQHALYETMLDAVPDLVYALDEDGRFLAVNETVEEFTGLAAEDAVGRHADIVMDDHDVEAGREFVRELLREDGPDEAIYEIDLHCANGETVPAENHVALLTDADGAFEGSVGVVRDVSRRRRRERRLTVLNRALRHDLRNSMHVVLANVELLADALDDPAHTSKLDTIRRRAEEITGLSEKAREIEQTLCTYETERHPVDLVPLLEAQLQAFRERHPEATVEMDLPDEAWVEATGLVDTAVENLVENSIQHTDDPTVSVSVTVDADAVRVTVADDGPGIPAKERRVVEHGSETPLDHASGLGLWLVAWITRDSGGEVEFVEDDEWGGVVTLTLDPADPAVTPASDDRDG